MFKANVVVGVEVVESMNDMTVSQETVSKVKADEADGSCD